MVASTSGCRLFEARRRAVVFVALAILAAPCAAWALAPDMLPSSAIWTNFMHKIHEPKAVLIHEEDTDGDGIADLKIYKHEDGAYIDVRLKPGPDGMIVDTVVLKEDLKEKHNWVYGYDTSDDGQIEMLVRGWFAEGKWDQMLVDSDHDGRPDRFLCDLDDNGIYDGMGVDIDADGKLDYLYDLDNKTGEVLYETVGWVTFKEQQRREALPQLVYSFVADLNTLRGQEPVIVSATWDYGDGALRKNDELVPGEHLFIKAGTYDVALDVQFKLPGADKVYKAWYGIELPVEPAAPGPAPLTPERLKASVNTFYGAAGFLAAQEVAQEGPISGLWPDIKFPEAAPVGNALRASAVAPGELEFAAFWWRSDAEVNAFLDAMEGTVDAAALPAAAAGGESAKVFELVSKVRAWTVEIKDGSRVAAWREGGFIVTITTNRTLEELQRWTRLLYDILHPALEKTEPSG